MTWKAKPCSPHSKTISSKDSITCWFLSVNITSTASVGFSYLSMNFILTTAAKWYPCLAYVLAFVVIFALNDSWPLRVVQKKFKLDREYHLSMGYNAFKDTASTSIVETYGDNPTRDYLYEDMLQHQDLVLSNAHGTYHERAGKDWYHQPVACPCHIWEMLKEVECDHYQW